MDFLRIFFFCGCTKAYIVQMGLNARNLSYLIPSEEIKCPTSVENVHGTYEFGVILGILTPYHAACDNLLGKVEFPPALHLQAIYELLSAHKS